MNRGARREDVFVDDDSRAVFLSVLQDLLRFGVRLHGYALLPNHYHLLLESLTGELSRAMRHVGAESTRRLNRIHRSDSPVFRGRYHNCLVDTDTCWRHLLVYVHQNPLRAGAGPVDDPLWTSHAAYLGLVARPSWLETAALQGLWGSAGGYAEYYQ